MDKIIVESDDFLHPSLLLTHSVNDNDFCMNNTVRANYFSYLKNLLKTNANIHDIKFSQVQSYAQQIEIMALRKSLNSTVYRKEMLKGIKTLKKCHEMNQPFTLIELDECTGTINLTGQKDNVTDSSSESSDFTVETKSSNKDGSTYLPEMPSSTVKVENFTENQSKFMISSTNDFDVAAAEPKQETIDVQQNIETLTYDPIYQELEKMFTDEKETICSPHSTSSAENNYLNNKHIWRCEYKIQKSSFLQQMYAIYVMNPEKYQRLENQLKEIFGPTSDGDDDDDKSSVKEVPMEELLKALKMKIAHMVKHNLMPYYSMKKIKTSDVYKMVAKAVTDRIVDLDPYMSFNAVRKAIKYCFNNRFKIIDAKNAKQCIKIIIWTIEHHFNF